MYVETVLLCSDNEGRPRVLQKAIATSKGVVAYDNPGSCEVFHQNFAEVLPPNPTGLWWYGGWAGRRRDGGDPLIFVVPFNLSLKSANVFSEYIGLVSTLLLTVGLQDF